MVLLLTGGFWSAFVNISLFAGLLSSGRRVEEAGAMTFVSLVLIQFFKAYNYRSDRLSVLHRPFANHWLNLADRVGARAARHHRLRAMARGRPSVRLPSV